MNYSHSAKNSWAFYYAQVENMVEKYKSQLENTVEKYKEVEKIKYRFKFKIHIIDNFIILKLRILLRNIKITT